MLSIPVDTVNALAASQNCQSLIEALLGASSQPGPWKDWVLLVSYGSHNRMREIMYHEDPSKWLETARRVSPFATYVLRKQEKVKSPVEDIPSRLDHHKKVAARWFSIKDLDSPPYAPEGYIRDDLYSANWQAPAGEPLKPNVGQEQVAIVVHPANSIKGDFLTVEFADVLKVSEGQKRQEHGVNYLHCEVLEGKGKGSQGFVMHARCVFKNILIDERPLKERVAAGAWATPCKQAKAFLDFPGDGPGRAALKKDDKLAVFDVKNHWAFVVNKSSGAYGWVPHRFVEAKDDA